MLLNTDDLRQWLGYKRTADIIKWLERNNVPWRRGSGDQICTTLDAVSKAIEGGEQRTPARF